jgi:peptidoglycan/xylan/chitin deacetylase (PgdA/CDA1 family)
MPSKVPQFVMFGSDDNPYAAGVNWLVDTAFGGKTNPDGSPAQMTFFITAGFGTDQMYGNPPVAGVFQPGTAAGGGAAQTPQDVVNSWKHAYAAGHEIANHTFHHPGPSNSTYTMTPATVADWQAELQPSQDFLMNQVGVPSCEIDGDRFPYLLFNDPGFQAYQAGGLLFDTSMEFGYNWWVPSTCNCNGFGNSSALSGMYYWWPMTLDSGPPSGGNDGFDPNLTKNVGAHAGFWEFFEHTFNEPDPSSTAWMTDPTKVGAVSTVYTITGLDYNLWLATLPTNGASRPPADFCTTLKYSFLQRYMGNRSPFNVGMHSMYYSGVDPTFDTDFNDTVDQRRAALQCFIDFLLSGSYPDVRIVGFHKVIEWMRNPTAIH